jgi:hemolysin D
MSTHHRLQAWGDLWGRYLRSLRHAWQQRERLSHTVLREDEAAFLPAALAVQAAPPSRSARWIAWLLVVMTLTALVWSVVGRMDIIVNAQGKVIPSSYTKTMAAVETGAIVALNVEEGQRVKVGDVLLQLDTRALDAERDKALGDRSEAVLSLARNQALLQALDEGCEPRLPAPEVLQAQYGVPFDADQWRSAALHLQGQYRDHQAKARKLNDDIAHYSEALPLAQRQAESYRRLAESHDVSRDAWQEKEQARQTIQAQLQEARNQLAALGTEARKAALDQMADARRQAAASAQDALRVVSTSRLLTLKAPVDGTVQQLAVHTVGGVVQAAQPLMQIVPSEGPVEVEAMIENKDKGFVHAGQKAEVKVETFEYTKYGTLPGRVTQVSEDAIPDDKHDRLNYAVKVLLAQSTLAVEGRATPVVPGMAVSVEIKTGERRLIEYVLSPLLQHSHEALNER